MKFLLCTDGSAASRAIVPHAGRLARALGAEVVIARVLDPRVDAASELSTDLEAAVGRVEQRWKVELQNELLTSGLTGTVVVPRRVWGKEVADAIHLAADEAGAVLVAIRSNNTGRMHHAIFGSVALGVLANADLPIMTVSGSEPPRSGAGPYHIMITSDGSPDARSVFEGLKRLLVPGRVRVTLLQVEPVLAQESPAEARARVLPGLEALLSRIPAGVEATARVDVVAPGEAIDKAIVAAAEAAGADAIASATHGQSAFRHFVAGSTALGLVRKATVPVILVKSRAAD